MNLHVDSHYLIGSSHSVCEDYAIHGDFSIKPYNDLPEKNVTFGIVADGCSQSSDSDVGARVVAWFIQRHLKRLLACSSFWYDDIFVNQQDGSYYGNLECSIPELTFAKRYIVFPESGDFMDATAWLVAVCDGNIFTFGAGDGALIVKRKSGTTIYCLTYESSAPFYLSYRLSQERKDLYVKTFDNTYVLSTVTIRPDGTKSVTHKNCVFDKPFILKLKNSEDDPIQTVSVCSDGFKTFTNGNEDAILGSLEWSVTRMIDYPTVEGVFVERSMRFLEKQDLKKQVHHLDDISMASVAFVPEAKDVEPK